MEVQRFHPERQSILRDLGGAGVAFGPLDRFCVGHPESIRDPQSVGFRDGPDEEVVT